MAIPSLYLQANGISRFVNERKLTIFSTRPVMTEIFKPEIRKTDRNNQLCGDIILFKFSQKFSSQIYHR